VALSPSRNRLFYCGKDKFPLEKPYTQFVLGIQLKKRNEAISKKLINMNKDQTVPQFYWSKNKKIKNKKIMYGSFIPNLTVFSLKLPHLPWLEIKYTSRR